MSSDLDLRSISLDLSLMEEDLSRSTTKGSLVCVLSYSELYRYVYPLMEYLKSADEPQFFVRQLALRYFINYRATEWIIPNATMRKYERDLNNLPARMNEALTDPGYDWSWLNLFVAEFVEEKFIRSNKMEAIKSYGLPINTSHISSSVVSSIKMSILTREYEDGINNLDELKNLPHVKRWPSDLELRLEQHEYYRDILSIFDNELRRGVSPELAEICTKLYLLNNVLDIQKKTFVVITETNRINYILKDLWRKGELPQLGDKPPYFCRSLRYCVLDCYLKFPGSEHDSSRERTIRLKNLVELRKKIADSVVLSKTLDKNISHLPLLKSYYERLEKNIRERLKSKSKSISKLESYVPSERIKDVLGSILENPREILEIGKDFDFTVREALRQLGALQKSDKKSEKKIYGKYKYKFTSKEEPYGSEIDTLHKKLMETPSRDYDKLTIIEKAIRELNQKIGGSPAMYVALAICNRWRLLFESSSNYLDLAAELSPENPEVFFNRAMLYRFRADELSKESGGEERRLKEEIRLLNKAIFESEKTFDDQTFIRPMFFQLNSYLCWRIVKIGKKSLYDKLTSSEKELIDKARSACEEAKKLEDFLATENKDIAKRINIDLAYFYSLLGTLDYVLKAKIIVEDSIYTNFDPSQIDTKAFTYFKYANLIDDKKDKVYYLKESARLYIKVLGAEGKYPKLYAEGLKKATDLLKDLGEKSIEI